MKKKNKKSKKPLLKKRWSVSLIMARPKPDGTTEIGLRQRIVEANTADQAIGMETKQAVVGNGLLISGMGALEIPERK